MTKEQDALDAFNLIVDHMGLENTAYDDEIAIVRKALTAPQVDVEELNTALEDIYRKWTGQGSTAKAIKERGATSLCRYMAKELKEKGLLKEGKE